MIEITGKLKQNGTPSPENPVEIENENYIIIRDEDDKITDKIPVSKLNLGKFELTKNDKIYKGKDGEWYIRKMKYKKI